MKLSWPSTTFPWQRQQQEQPPAAGQGVGLDDRRSSTGSEASFKTASEGPTPSPPQLRVISPSGGSYAPSFPSTSRSFAHVAAGDVPLATPPPPPARMPQPPTTTPMAAAPAAAMPPASGVSPGLMERLKAQRAARLREHGGDQKRDAELATVPQQPRAPPPPLPQQQQFPSSPRPSQLSSPSVSEGIEEETSPHVDRANDRQLEEAGWAGGWAEEGENPGGWTHGQSSNVLHPSVYPSQQHYVPHDFAYSPAHPSYSQQESHRYPYEHGWSDPDGVNDYFPHEAESAGRTPIPASFPHLDNFSSHHAHDAFHPETAQFLPDHPGSPASEGTVLHEAGGIPSSASPSAPAASAGPAARHTSRAKSNGHGSLSWHQQDPWLIRAEREKREREKMMQWERAQRAHSGTADPLQGLEASMTSRAASRRGSVGGTTLVDEQVGAAERRESRSRSGTSPSSGTAERKDKILAEGRLLLPPTERSFPHDLHHPALWTPFYALLTARGLKVFPPEQPSYTLFKVSEISQVGRLDEHDKESFEPFFVDLRNGARVVLAGRKKLEAAYWVLAIENARTHAQHHSSPSPTSSQIRSSVYHPRFSPSPSSHRRSTNAESSPRTPLPSAHTAHLSRLEKLIDDMNRRTRSSFLPQEGKHDWMGRFNEDVQARTTLVELAPDAQTDDWGEHQHLGETQHASHLKQPLPGWPARPPPEEARPPSSHVSTSKPPHDHPLHTDPSYLHPADALHLQAILDSLLLTRAGQHERAADVQLRIEAARDELHWMKEEVEARCAAEGRIGEADRALLDKLDWLLHLNAIRARKQNPDASLDGRGSTPQGFAEEFSAPEETIVREVQMQIAAMLDGERKRDDMVRGRKRKMKRDRAQRSSAHTSPTSLPAQTPQTYHQHASDAVFSPVSFGPPGQTTWSNSPGPSPRHLGGGDTFDHAARGATSGGVASRFSPNTSEQITPPRPARPQHDSILPGELRSFPYDQAEEEPVHEEPLRDLPSSLRHHLDYRDLHDSPSGIEERLKWEKERYLQDVRPLSFDFIAASGVHDARMSDRLKELLESVRAASLDRSAQDALTVSKLHEIASALRDLDNFSGPAVLTTPHGVKVFGGPDPIPPSHHQPRWKDGASGAKAAKELDTLIKHEQARTASTALAAGGGSRGGKAKIKAGKEHAIVREMENNEAVKRALEVWKGEELVGREEEKGEGRGVVDPAAKAFAIFEILHATREIAKKHKEEAERLKKAAKQRNRPVSPLPAVNWQPQDGT
ncbi:hypothetical protein JCM11251_006328 [Rhodosporidiobolus azoricus]